MIENYGPRTTAADQLHALKYREDGESFREAVNRRAFALKDDDAHYHVLRDILGNMRFMEAGRVQCAMGSSRQTTPWNCFVSGTIADSFVDGEGSICARVVEAAATMRMGGGIGYDFSTLRPKGDLIRKLGSNSSGPVSFIGIYNEVGLCTASAGHRRGAQMGILRVDHPDIEEFVRAKQNTTALTGFNVSVAVTNAFMEAVYAKKTFDLVWGGKTYRTVDAEELWEKIMRSTWDWGEPGVFFVDQVNHMNNLSYCETIAATNPCGEQPLPPFGACLLGSYNLVKYLIKTSRVVHFSTGEAAETAQLVGYDFDYDLLKADIPPIVRAMDNIIDRGRYPLPKQKAEGVTKRRMGLGVTGLANAAEAQGFAYGSPQFLQFEAKVLQLITEHSYLASADLARTKGAFPLYDEVQYPKSPFIQTLPDHVQHAIRRHGIRNSHLTSIAPTGTISMAADNVSSGLEPVFAHSLNRPINTPDGPVVATIEDYGAAFLGVKGKLSAQVTAREHVDVLTTAQRYVDSAVSKTCNVTSAMSWDDFKDVYRRAFEGGAKGCTTFRSDGMRGSLLSAAPAGDDAQPAPAAERRETMCVIGENGVRDCG